MAYQHPLHTNLAVHSGRAWNNVSSLNLCVTRHRACSLSPCPVQVDDLDYAIRKKDPSKADEALKDALAALDTVLQTLSLA